MVTKAEVLEMLTKAIIDYDEEKAVEAAKLAVEAKLEIMEAIEKGLSVGIKEVGDRFGRFEYPLPYVIMAANAMTAAVNYLKERYPKDKLPKPKGKVVIGTAFGDIHSIGKNLIADMLRTDGFEVYDLGEEIPTENYVNKAEEVGADIVAMGALMTSSMSYQKALVDTLIERGLKSKYKVLVGGTPMTDDFCKRIKADAWGADCGDAIKKARMLVGKT
jgi:corrinoid protein of di/trimethylamine methyltransferase